MTAGFPPGLDTFFDIGDNDLDNDYDLAEEDPAGFQADPEVPEQIFQERPVKAYLVKYTAYKTLVGDS